VLVGAPAALNTVPEPAHTFTVPDVAGMPLRDAVRRLHAAGFQLRVEGSGRVLRTVPAAGAASARTTVLRVVGEASR
jgi:beta-lactam-binding protein with PASTA domain